MKLLIFLLSFLISSCTPNKPEVTQEIQEYPNFYINGIKVSAQDAKDASKLLYDETGYIFENVYNTSQSFAKDLLQSSAQYLSEKNISLRHYEMEIYSEEEKLEMEKVIHFGRNADVLIVAHSQGNFFANFLCEKGSAKKRTIQIANPSSIKTKCETLLVNFGNDPLIFLLPLIDKSRFFSKPREAKFHYNSGKGLAFFEKMLQKGVVDLELLFQNHYFYTYFMEEPSSAIAIREAVYNARALPMRKSQYEQ